MSKESFKVFARNHPELATKVMNNDVSWQKLYELYEMYGEESDVWDNYLIRKATAATTSLSFLTLMSFT